MKDFLLFYLLFCLYILGSIGNSFASPACPVCTIAVGASLSLAYKLGLEESVVGLWSGALLTLLGYWSIVFFDKKKWNFKGRNLLLIFLSVAMIGLIYIKETMYSPRVIWFIFYLDPILFGTLLGSLSFIFSVKLYKYMKEKNNGKAHFPFEKVVLPILVLIVISFYLSFFKI